METNDRTKEILDTIYSTLKVGKAEIIFRKSEVDSNPIINWLCDNDLASKLPWITALDESNDLEPSDNYHIYFNINKQKFIKFYAERSQTKSDTNRININRLITKDSITGKFLYNGKDVGLDNPQRIYYKIVDCLYLRSIQYPENTLCFYDEINDYLAENGENPIIDKIKSRRRINNGLTNLYRFTTWPEKLIEKIRGVGLRLGNPAI